MAFLFLRSGSGVTFLFQERIGAFSWRVSGRRIFLYCIGLFYGRLLLSLSGRKIHGGAFEVHRFLCAFPLKTPVPLLSAFFNSYAVCPYRYQQISFFDVLRLIKNCFAEFILLQWTPLGNEVLISAGWFVPAVFFGGLFFVIILALTGKTGGYIIAPLISFFIYRYYFNLIGKIDVIYAYHSVLRGVAGVALGVFIYFLCKHLRSLMDKLSKGGLLSKLSCIFASVIFLCIFIYTSYGRRSKWDFLVIALYGTGLLFLMAGSVKLPEKLDKVFLFMGKITYPVYVFQMPVIEVILALIR